MEKVTFKEEHMLYNHDNTTTQCDDDGLLLPLSPSPPQDSDTSTPVSLTTLPNIWSTHPESFLRFSHRRLNIDKQYFHKIFFLVV